MPDPGADLRMSGATGLVTTVCCRLRGGCGAMGPVVEFTALQKSGVQSEHEAMRLGRVYWNRRDG